MIKNEGYTPTNKLDISRPPGYNPKLKCLYCGSVCFVTCFPALKLKGIKCKNKECQFLVACLPQHIMRLVKKHREIQHKCKNFCDELTWERVQGLLESIGHNEV